jgi:hypothetical protein
MPFLVSFHNLQKREFSKESKGKLFFCLISSSDFFSVSGIRNQISLPLSRPPGSILVGKDEGDFVSF